MHRHCALLADALFSAQRKDYITALDICESARKKIIHGRMRYRFTGARKALLCACMWGRSNYRLRGLRKQLGVYIYTAAAVLTFFKASKKLMSAAKKLLDQMIHAPHPIRFIQPSNTSRTKFPPKVPDYVIGWILRNTTPSSNMRNTVRVEVPKRPSFIPVRKLRGGRVFVEHVVRWRTDSLMDMYQSCKNEVPPHFTDAEKSFSFKYFYDCIPDFVKMRKKMDGLCPIHHSGMSWENEIAQHRLKWHKNCACKSCVFCKPAPHGCDHGRNPLGGSCTRFTCVRCKHKRCFVDWATNMHTQWIVKVQRTRDTGGTTWVDEVEKGTRHEFMQQARNEMETFDKHHQHSQWHKRKVAELLANLRPGEVYIKFDYIQNIVHERGAETSSSYYGKRQTQFLSFVVWYCKKDANGNITRHKIYRDYLSSYLKHNSLYWQKSMKHLLRHLTNKLKIKINKVLYTSVAVSSNYSYSCGSILMEERRILNLGYLSGLLPNYQ